MLFGDGDDPAPRRPPLGRAGRRPSPRPTCSGRRETGRPSDQRVHYGPLDVEDLGRVYEALLELEPGIATEPMCRLRRPEARGRRPARAGRAVPGQGRSEPAPTACDEEATTPTTRRGGRRDSEGEKTKVDWIEEIRRGRVLPPRRPRPEGDRLLLHAASLRPLPRAGDARPAGRRAEPRPRARSGRPPRALGPRPGDGLRALPRRGLPLPRREALRGVPPLRRAGRPGRRGRGGSRLRRGQGPARSPRRRAAPRASRSSPTPTT